MNISDLEKVNRENKQQNIQNEKNTDSAQDQTQPSEQVVSSESPESQSQISHTKTKIKYAGFWISILACFMDGIIVLIFSIIVGVAIDIFFIISGIDGGLLTFLDGLFGLLVGWVYYVYMTYNYEATFGKQLFGLKVFSTSETEIDLGQVFLHKTVGKIISGIIMGIGYFMIGFDSYK